MALLPTASPPVEPCAERDSRRGPLLRAVRDQRVAFVLVGAVNTLLGLVWFVLFYVSVGRFTGYLVTLLLAHVAAVLCAFLLHRRFVFKVRGHFWLDLARFEVVNLSALGVNAALLPVAVELLALPVLTAQLLVTGVTVVISFFAHRGFSFHRRAEQETR